MEALGTRPLRVGLVGVGYWGPHYLRILDGFSGAEAGWACDLDAGALDFAARRYPGLRTSEDYTELLADRDLDAVVVATPPSTHAEIAERALEADKHVLAEKPLAMSSADCDRLGRLASDRDLVLMAGHTYVFNPAVRMMREAIAEGAIGTVRYIRCTRAGPGPIRPGMNALWDLAPHDLAMILFATEAAPLEVSAVGGYHLGTEHEDVVFTTIELEGGVLAHVHVSWIDALKVRRVSVVGERGTIVFDDLESEEKLRIVERGPDQDAIALEARGKPYGEYREIHRDGRIIVPKVPALEPLREQVAHFVACCRNGVAPETDAASAARVLEVLEAAGRSLAQNGHAVSVERANAPSPAS